MRPVVPVFAVVLFVAASTGCGGGNAEARQAALPEVPTELAPAALGGGRFTLSEDEEARKAFAGVGDSALIADGRLWQIRQGKTLVGTLQVSTMKNKVDLTDADQRKSIAESIIPTMRHEIDVDGMTVYTTRSNDKVVYLWFGRRVYQVLQVKGRDLDPESMLNELVAHQTSLPVWEPLPVPSGDEDEFDDDD